MTTVFYHQFTSPFSNSQWEWYFQQMPSDIQIRIKRYRQQENKYQLLIGRLLLKSGMQRMGFKDFQLEDLYYNENNCPIWRSDICFNISHASNVVGCAISDDLKIGLDIEKIKEIPLNNFEYILNEIDHQNIRNASNPYIAFFKIWTIKEAVTKALQKGLAIDVQQIYIHEDYALFEKQKWYYQTLNFQTGIAAHIVSNTPDWEALQFVPISFN